MSFVTVFTIGTMAFVLVVPTLMILALTTLSPLRRAVNGAVGAFGEEQEEPSERELLPAAA